MVTSGSQSKSITIILLVHVLFVLLHPLLKCLQLLLRVILRVQTVVLLELHSDVVRLFQLWWCSLRLSRLLLERPLHDLSLLMRLPFSNPINEILRLPLLLAQFHIKSRGGRVGSQNDFTLISLRMHILGHPARPFISIPPFGLLPASLHAPRRLCPRAPIAPALHSRRSHTSTRMCNPCCPLAQPALLQIHLWNPALATR